jgi:phage tail sheath protein FI
MRWRRSPARWLERPERMRKIPRCNFPGSGPPDAYFVKCDRDTTTQADINRGVVNIVVGFAPLRPAEFVVLTIRQIAGCTRP